MNLTSSNRVALKNLREALATKEVSLIFRVIIVLVIK
jgi:hypothetical protein